MEPYSILAFLPGLQMGQGLWRVARNQQLQQEGYGEQGYLSREQSRRVEAWSGGPEGGLQTAFGEGGWVCKAGICETLLMPLLPGLQLLAREDEVFSSLPSP